MAERNNDKSKNEVSIMEAKNKSLLDEDVDKSFISDYMNKQSTPAPDGLTAMNKETCLKHLDAD